MEESRKIVYHNREGLCGLILEEKNVDDGFSGAIFMIFNKFPLVPKA